LFASNTQVRAFSFSAEDGVFGVVRGRLRRETDLDSSLRGILGQDRSFEEVVGEVGAFKAIGGPGFANHVLAFRLSGGMGFGPGADAFHFELGGAEGVAEGVTGLGLFGGTPLLFPVRGYPRDFRFGRLAWSASAEYRFPIALVDRGLGSFPLHFDRIHGSVFFDAGNAWGPELGVTGFENPRMGDLASVGAEMSVMLQPFYAGTVRMRFGFGYPLRVLSDPRFYVRIGSPF
ncbi:MAG: BamA/TamA family outer membrane protein, partial [Gemmatimonadetes bacterium]|nr:BamA/TamA family outer membrane protein [Gemmatimonadota bacterium]